MKTFIRLGLKYGKNMNIFSRILNIVGVLAIISLMILIASDRFKGDDYQYKLSHDRFVKYSIQNAIKESHKNKVVDFGVTEVQHLSGKTFMLSGTVMFEGVFNNKIQQNFECIATGRIWESNPSGSYDVNIFIEK